MEEVIHQRKKEIT
jgi:t-SNARE complex subunit (syntaxin)